MFNTEYNGASNDVDVLDAVGAVRVRRRSSTSGSGRFLPPSDRANLYGPYYSHHWARLHRRRPGRLSVHLPGPRQRRRCTGASSARSRCRPARSTARSATGDDTFIGAGRVQVDFWDPEAGYYLNGTYYGDKNLLAIGAAGQVQGGDKSAYNVDFLLERKVPGGGACLGRSRVGEVRPARRLQRAATAPTTAATCSARYLFPQMVGTGRFEVLGKFAKAQLPRRASRRSTPTTTRRRPRSTSTTSSSSSTRA